MPEQPRRAGGYNHAGLDHDFDLAGVAPGDLNAFKREQASIPIDSIDRPAIGRLLSRLLAAGVRIVARGDGAVHVCAGDRSFPAELRAELTRLHGHIDALARWAAWESPGRRRQTAATALLAFLRRHGVGVTPKPGCVIELSGLPPDLAERSRGRVKDPLELLTLASKKEAWFRLVCGLPDPSDPADEGVSLARLSALAALHRHCLDQAEKAESRPRRAGTTSAAARARHWKEMAAAVARVRAGQAAPAATLDNLVTWCRVQADRATKRRQTKAASRWSAWNDALAEAARRGREQGELTAPAGLTARQR